MITGLNHREDCRHAGRHTLSCDLWEASSNSQFKRKLTVGPYHLYSGEMDGAVVITRENGIPEVTVEEVAELLSNTELDKMIWERIREADAQYAATKDPVWYGRADALRVVAGLLMKVS